jgi:hypothetical protein
LASNGLSDRCSFWRDRILEQGLLVFSAMVDTDKLEIENFKFEILNLKFSICHLQFFQFINVQKYLYIAINPSLPLMVKLQNTVARSPIFLRVLTCQLISV